MASSPTWLEIILAGLLGFAVNEVTHADALGILVFLAALVFMGVWRARTH